MEVGDGFAAVGAVVDDEAETLSEIEFGGDQTRHLEKVAEGPGILFGGGADPVYPFLRDDQEMDRSLRTDVVDDHTMLILKFQSGRDLPVDDAAEDRFVGHGEIGLKE